MRLLIATYRSAANPELLEALAPDGTHTALIDKRPDIEAYKQVACRLMTKLGYRQSDYAFVDGTSTADRHWTFVMSVPDTPFRNRAS